MTTKRIFGLIFITTITQSVFSSESAALSKPVLSPQDTQLFQALENKNFKKAEELVLEKKANVNCIDKGGYSPLLTAVEKEDSNSALLLLENGADVNFQSRLGSTALMFAASNNDLEMATLLIVFNADALIKEKDLPTFKKDKINKGLTAREIAIRKQSLYMRNGKVINQEGLTTNKILQKLLEKTEAAQEASLKENTRSETLSKHDSAISLTGETEQP